MTSTASALFRLSALSFVAALGLTACGSDDTGTPQPDTSSSQTLEVPEAPEANEQETALAETLESDFEVTSTATLPDQWPDLTAMVAALEGTENPDLCQQAGAEQYGLMIEAQPPTVEAVFDQDALLDENASGETATVFYSNDATTTKEIHEAYQNTDTSCVEENESAIEHEGTEKEVADVNVEVHTWQVVASEQLTGRMVDVVNDSAFVRYAASYPPQVLIEDLEDDAAEQFNEAATERAMEIFEAAVTQPESTASPSTAPTD